jgi:uncharacterized membrane protein YdjX (TVP38/TMEM64 family)
LQGGLVLSRKKKASFLTLLIPISIIIFLYPRVQNPEAFQSLILQLGWKGIFLDLLFIATLMFFPIIPFSLIAGINIVIYGWIGGFLISLMGSLIGSAMSFSVGRYLGQEWARPHLAKLGKWGKLSDAKNFYLIVLARLIPVLPSAAVNYAAGVSPMKFTHFLLATLLGKIPMIAWESWFGHDFWHLMQHPRRFVLALISGAAIFSTAWLVWVYIDSKEKAKA